MEKSLRMENQKRKRVTGKKRKKEEKKKKNRPKEERKSTILSRKEKTFFVKATGTGGAPRCPDFEQEIAGKPKCLKQGFLFFMRVPALTQKH